ncbi:MAG: bifunctional diaminohydroxyphosphoribosylaminopyrimidine deaminase/5-amino-6-(5-phosphoribosylamino)uracil reductase RibD [bacterium]|nr:bifunctional diaminohydroxyphosphoribosylaminopyrimidine deaminase/5-amino-6-(5-phosphoribosylamino)uracil reductase RibD [bacterium]
MSRRAPSDNREVDSREGGWMRRAVALAAASQPHPNPRVGAVVLTPGGEEIGAAFHAGPGTPHAEVLALGQAGDRARGATLVTTLEPCSHYGRTPPCADALIDAGVARVVVGTVDPDRQVSGAGIDRLREAGIDVTVGVAEADALALDPGYFHHRRTGLARFRLKLAATLDGQTAARDGTSQWITSGEAREDAHQLRAAADAVMIGAGTLRADDPLLDVRIDTFQGEQPRPVVVAGALPLPEGRRLYGRSPLVYAPAPLEPVSGCEVVVAAGHSGVDLLTMGKDLASRGILEVLVDGGPRLATSFLEAGLADQLTVYFGAKVAGGSGLPMFSSVFTTLQAATNIDIFTVTKVGPDLRVDARVREEPA